MRESLQNAFNLASLVAFMCGAYAVLATSYNWQFHVNLLKQLRWYLS
jgi:hypothetical protein